MPIKTDKLADLAREINKYLKKFEADPAINKRLDDKKYRIKPYYNSGAWDAGRYVSVCYVSFQGRSNLTKPQARAYLDWLHEGNVGHHWQALRQMEEGADAR